MTSKRKNTAAPLWTDLDADVFGADTAGTLFDASTLTRKADKCGTPDMFADADAPRFGADEYLTW